MQELSGSFHVAKQWNYRVSNTFGAMVTYWCLEGVFHTLVVIHILIAKSQCEVNNFSAFNGCKHTDWKRLHNFIKSPQQGSAIEMEYHKALSLLTQSLLQ